MTKLLSNIIFIVGVVMIVTSWNFYYILGMILIIIGLLIDPPVAFKTYFKNIFSK
jgi:multisubunit Na+/H+ antiporter MnhG subunit